ncbi:MAG: hypothetical protein ACT4N5_05490 [Nitrosopumilaceae archaeon]
MTKAHVEIIEHLKRTNSVRVYPVIFSFKGKEINSKSFPFTFELRKNMLHSVFGDSISIQSSYSFSAPFIKYMPPLFSPFSWRIKKQILEGVSDDYFTYTGDKAEGIVLKLYGLKPRIGIRRTISASLVKEKMFDAALGKESDWEKYVPSEVVKIIHEHWDVVKQYASSDDFTYRLLGMKFPKNGFWLEK